MASLAVPERGQRWKDRLDALARPARLPAAQREHRDPEVFRRGQVREDAAVVRHVADPQGRKPFRRVSGDGLRFEPDDASTPGDVQTGEAAQRGGLSHSVAPEERDDLAARDREADVVQDVRESVAGVEVLDLEQRRALPRRSSLNGSDVRLAEIDLAHVGVVADLLWRAVREHPSLMQHDDAGGESEDHLHVVLDEEDGERLLHRERPDLREHAIALSGAHPGGRFVQQQKAGLGGEREGNLQQPPIPVREQARWIAAAGGEPDGIEQPLDGRLQAGDRVQPVARVERAPCPREHRDRHVLLHRKQGKDVGDLERPGHSAADARARRPPGHVLSREHDVAVARRQLSGEEVDEGGLAGAIGTDDGRDSAFRKGEVDASYGGEVIERLLQSAHLQQRRHGRCLRRSQAVSAPINPPRKVRTVARSTRPKTSSQYSVKRTMISFRPR